MKNRHAPLRSPNVMPAPAPMAMAPAAVPVAPPPQHASCSADTLIGFDKAAVRPEAKAKLDEFSNQLNGTTYSSFSVKALPNARAPPLEARRCRASAPTR